MFHLRLAGFGIDADVWRGEASGFVNAEETVIVRAGWPLRCLQWRTEADLWRYDRGIERPPSSFHTGIRIGPKSRRDERGRPEKRLPLEPLPLGLAANIAMYASVCWCLLYVASRIRVASRLRHRRCPTCAYDLRATLPTSPCPECGSLSPQNP